MTPLVLSAVLAAAAAAPSLPGLGSPPDAGGPAGAPDGGRTRIDPVRPWTPSVQRPRGVIVQVKAVEGAPEPSLRVAVQAPPGPDAGTPRNERARTESTNPQPDPFMLALLEQSRAQSEALLEQSRTQTETLQQIAAQQRASEAARLADQQRQVQRAGQLNDARMDIDGALRSLQGIGDWNEDSLASTGASLRQTAAGALEAGSAGEASRAAEAARLVEAARAALSQRNSQLAQYYLLAASQLLLQAYKLPD